MLLIKNSFLKIIYSLLFPSLLSREGFSTFSYLNSPKQMHLRKHTLTKPADLLETNHQQWATISSFALKKEWNSSHSCLPHRRAGPGNITFAFDTTDPPRANQLANKSQRGLSISYSWARSSWCAEEGRRCVQYPSRASTLLFSFQSNIPVINFSAKFPLSFIINNDHFRAFQRGNTVLCSMEINLLTPLELCK